MGSFSGSSPVAVDCEFRANSARHSGGAVVSAEGCRPIFRRCVFSGNWTENGGGAVSNQGGSLVTIENCIIADNVADGFGGAVENYSAEVLLRLCTISYNHAGWVCGGISSGLSSTVRLENCILWGNTDGEERNLEQAQLTDDSNGTTVDYSCVQGWTGDFDGTGSFGHDPLFADRERGDFHLRSEGWRWDGRRRRWTYDRRTSPCIDTGHPGQSAGDEPAVVPDGPNGVPAVNRRVNMGAYGGTSEATLPPPDWSLRADINNDGRVDWRDLHRVASDWGRPTASAYGDLTWDGTIDGRDLAVVGTEWCRRVRAPKVEIAEPRNGSVVVASGATEVMIRAEAWDVDGRIVRVAFLVDGGHLAFDEDDADGWGVVWNDVGAGTFTLRALATGEDAVQTLSAPVTVTVVTTR
jgi:hypothetical protein